MFDTRDGASVAAIAAWRAAEQVLIATNDQAAAAISCAGLRAAA